MTQVTYKSEKISTKRVYFTGSDMLGEGYCLCYNRDSTTTGGSAGAADIARAYEVEKPAADNLKYFAGVLGADDAGKTGPCWITIIEPQPNPGRLVKVHTDQNCTLGTTKLAVQSNSYAAGAAGASNVTVATAMQTVDRSGANGTVLAQLEGASSIEVDVAAAVTGTQQTLSAPAGSTAGGTHTLQTAGLSTGVMGGTLGAGSSAVIFDDVAGGSWGEGKEPIENNFTKLANQITNIRNDFARLVTEVNSTRTDVAAILAALKNANLMAS